MGSISSSLPTIPFTGQSTFSASLQAELNREVDIATLPIQQMQSDVAGLQSQQQALTGLQSAFTALQSSLTSIGSTTAGSLSANVSDSSVASATAGSTASPGSYTIQVDQVGTATTALSNAGTPPVTDPSTGDISASSTFTLSVNGTNYTITPTGNNLNALAAAINSTSAGVEATIVNVGGSSGADYRLVLTSSNVGDTTIQLNDGTDLMSTVSPGTNAEYSVDGSSQVESTSNQITLAPGVTVNLLEASSSPVTVTVGESYSSLSNALSNFASAYNSAVNSVDQQIGQNAGPLAGQSVIYSLTNALNTLVNYTGGSGNVNSLASLGFTLGSDGQLSYDPTVFNSQSTSDIQQFLGGVATGGFLQTASTAIAGVADPTNGAIQSEFNTLQTEVTNENAEISDAETRVNDMETNLAQQLSQADATIANLQAQTTYYTELFNAQFPSSTSSSSGG